LGACRLGSRGHPGFAMETPQPHPSRTLVRPLPLGGALRLDRGDLSLLLESQGGQCRMVKVQDGRPVKELLLGIGGRGEVYLEVFPPERPLVLELEPQVALGPGGWLKGYVLVPLGWRVWIGTGKGPARFLEKLPPPGLKLSFLGNSGKGYVHPFQARLLSRRPFPRDPSGSAVLAVHMVNREREWVDLSRIYLPLFKAGVRRTGEIFVIDPVRVVLSGRGATLQMRSMERGGLPAREAAS